MAKRKSQTDEPVEPVEVPAGPEAPEAEVEVPEEAATVIELLQAELAEAVEARKRALADFANYQRRAAENEGRARRSGAADVDPNHIVSVLQPGYMMGDLVLRPAKVAVAAPSDQGS
jgi:molecular chaperone GrpE (heat shock protein)